MESGADDEVVREVVAKNINMFKNDNEPDVYDDIVVIRMSKMDQDDDWDSWDPVPTMKFCAK